MSAWTLELARNEIRAIYEESDVNVLWVDGSEPETPVNLVVLFRDSETFPIETDPSALGIAFVGTIESAPTTRVAVVFPDRLERLLSCECPVRMGRALGRAIAHEIGHSLLSASGHSDRGLMRASIPRSRWLAAHRNDFFFADSDAATIHGRLGGPKR